MLPAPLIPGSGWTRRRFLGLALAVPAGISGISCRSTSTLPTSTSKTPDRFFFVSEGKTVMMNADGTGRRVLELSVPNQATWQPAGFFPDGQRVLLLSMEPRRDGPGKPFEEYYTQTPTHLWIYNLDTGALEEIATRDRIAVFYTPQLLLANGRLLVQVVKNRVGQVYNMNLDGSDAREFTRAGEGLPYGFSLSPDGRRVAYHLAGPNGYEIWTSNPEGGERVRVRAHPEHLYFGPQWSPDSEWLAYSDCLFRNDPGHDWCDVEVCRPDGREPRLLTRGQSMWFAATYGDAAHRGGGSNVVAWTRDGAVLIPQRLPDSKVAWEYQAQRPDTDHFNRDFKPDAARGGTHLTSIHPQTLAEQSLTPAIPGRWDFRGCQSADGQWTLFCRADTGGVPSLWIQDTQARVPRELATSPAGVDHPRWVGQR
ncbi:MAG: serine/threonine protein kinase [Verrucomicrobia bacterium]|nr:serine/threonine protein kinase [Verrucomicrobiota bacterium]